MRGSKAARWGLVLGLLLGMFAAGASDLDEFAVKRKEVFEFTSHPAVTRQGDHVTIRFAAKDFCDATVAVENSDGRIIRHLASGVLGKNPPPPFQKDSLAQTVVWDGKDDQGRYVDDKDSHKVRVSLGLKPQFERALFWEPRKRWSDWSMPVQAAPEGVYVLDNGEGHAQLQLYDHAGNYVRTLYPFPADQLANVKGLNYHQFPQLEKPVPLMRGFLQATLLTSGTKNTVTKEGLGIGTSTGSKGPDYVAGAIAVRGTRIALADQKLNRIATDGSTGGLPLEGPEVSKQGYRRGAKPDDQPQAGPTSMAFSPDGEKLYMAGYNWISGGSGTDCLSGVAVMDYAKDDAPKVFAGSLKAEERGAKPGEFNCATSVAVDKQGRVYVSDYINGRIQVFAPDGKFLKEIPVYRPAVVEVHPKTQEIYVFQWIYFTTELDKLQSQREKEHKKGRETINCKLIKLGTFDNPKQLAEWPLPLPPRDAIVGYSGFIEGVRYWGALDGYGDKTRIWINRGRGDRGGGYEDKFETESWTDRGIQMLVEQDGKLELERHFGKETEKTVFRTKPPKGFNQMLYVNPSNGKLYLHEGDSGCLYKCCQQLLEIDPETGAVKPIELPFSALDLAFDLNNLIYLRTTDVVGRFDFKTMREVPFDYGEELKKVGGGSFSKQNGLLGGLVMPSGSPVCFHQGGMDVNVHGVLAVACHNRSTVADGLRHGEEHTTYGKPYAPQFYPGRVSSPTTCCVHVWDKHGQVKYEDAVGGLPQLDGVHIDRNDDLYLMLCPTRLVDGNKYFNDMSSTLAKFRPKQAKIISGNKNTPIPLSGDGRPDGNAQLYGGGMGPGWVRSAEWLYGGVGFAGFNAGRAGGGCACWWARSAIDYFARSIAPEKDLYSVAVLDANGNLILRIGQYGNADSAGADSKVPLGGDEVGLVHAKFVASHTDRRIFIADAGNHRISGVKLGYHASETIALKDIPEKEGE